MGPASPALGVCLLDLLRVLSQVPIAEAGALCRHDWMRQALCIWLQRAGLQQELNGNGSQRELNQVSV